MEQNSKQKLDGMSDSGKAATFGRFMNLCLPAWQGLELAKEILGKTIPAESREVAEKYQKDIETKLNLTYEAAQAAVADTKSVRDDDLRHGAFDEWESSRGQ